MRLKFTSPHVQDKSAHYNYASSRSLLGGVARVMKLGGGGGERAPKARILERLGAMLPQEIFDY